jgi:hypothetical protein
MHEKALRFDKSIKNRNKCPKIGMKKPASWYKLKASDKNGPK